MTFERMKTIEPELQRLEASAENAGRHGASWWDFLLASHKSLSKAVGRGSAHEQLQSAQAYEVCRAALFSSWSRGRKSEPVDEPSASSWRTCFDDGAGAVQTSFIDVSEAYR